jgi:hypothetical protein
VRASCLGLVRQSVSGVRSSVLCELRLNVGADGSSAGATHLLPKCLSALKHTQVSSYILAGSDFPAEIATELKTTKTSPFLFLVNHRNK